MTKKTNKSLRQEIQDSLIRFLDDEENGTDKCIDEIIKIFERHGYRKVETIDGSWSD